MIIKTSPDKEKAQSILNLAGKRLEFVESIDLKAFPTNKAEGYYEVIKEIIAALALLNGCKAVGEGAHKDLIDFSAKQNILDSAEISLVDDLRIRRNKSSYEGKEIESNYIENKHQAIKSVINKLISTLKIRLKTSQHL